MMPTIYLDSNATSKPAPEVVEVLVLPPDAFANAVAASAAIAANSMSVWRRARRRVVADCGNSSIE